MRATGDKLEEKFIIPIARELAVGLKAIHDAGIIHRDVKGKKIIYHPKLTTHGLFTDRLHIQLPTSSFMRKGAYRSAISVWLVSCNLSLINAQLGLELPTGCRQRCFRTAEERLTSTAVR